MFRINRGQAEELSVLNRTEEPAHSVVIYQSELDFVSRWILDYPYCETGGELFGFWTATGVPIVLYAIGPGLNANHQVAFYNQDMAYLLTVGKILMSRFGLQHIGEWHSHHQLGLAHPSEYDAATMMHGIKRQNLGRFLLGIGTYTEKGSLFNAFNFSQKAGKAYRCATWDVKDGESPYRKVVDADCELTSILRFPKTTQACYGELNMSKEKMCYMLPAYDKAYWLNVKANNNELKRIIDELSAIAEGGVCRAQIDSQHIVHLIFQKLGHNIRVVFPQGFPLLPPLVMRDGAEIKKKGNKWKFTGKVALSFLNYFKSFNLEEVQV